MIKRRVTNAFLLSGTRIQEGDLIITPTPGSNQIELCYVWENKVHTTTLLRPASAATMTPREKELLKEAQEKAIDNYRAFEGRCLDTSEQVMSWEVANNLIYKPLTNIPFYLKGARLYTWIINNLSYIWTKDMFVSKSNTGIICISEWRYNYHNVSKQSKIYKYNALEDCFLTGVCYDIDALETFIAFVKNPDLETTAQDLLNSRTTLQSMIEKEEEFFNSLECIREELESLDLEFFKDGTICGKL